MIFVITLGGMYGSPKTASTALDTMLQHTRPKACFSKVPKLFGPISGATIPFIDLFHNGGQIKYSFVLMLISPTSLATKSKFQKNIRFKTRAVGLINIKTKECKSGRHL